MGTECGSACAGGLGVLGGLVHLNANSSVMAGLADVKAQIQADRQARAERVRVL
jgi:citrate synthase